MEFAWNSFAVSAGWPFPRQRLQARGKAGEVEEKLGRSFANWKGYREGYLGQAAISNCIVFSEKHSIHSEFAVYGRKVLILEEKGGLVYGGYEHTLCTHTYSTPTRSLCTYTYGTPAQVCAHTHIALLHTHTALLHTLCAHTHMAHLHTVCVYIAHLHTIHAHPHIALLHTICAHTI